MELVRDVGGAGKIFYRRRRRRVKRKSGNIDDFCRRWGSNYSYGGAGRRQRDER